MTECIRNCFKIKKRDSKMKKCIGKSSKMKECIGKSSKMKKHDSKIKECIGIFVPS